MCCESSWLFGFTDSREEDAMAGMLWCEQWWTLLPVLSDSCCSSEAAELIKWLLSVTRSHTICFHINWLHPAGKGTKHPFAKANGRRHTCSWVVACFLPLSHAILVRLSVAWSATLSPASHIKAVLSVPLVAKWLWGGGGAQKWESRCFPRGVQQIKSRIWEMTVWMVWFSLPSIS